jgi:hypothetical protein
VTVAVSFAYFAILAVKQKLHALILGGRSPDLFGLSLRSVN